MTGRADDAAPADGKPVRCLRRILLPAVHALQQLRLITQQCGYADLKDPQDILPRRLRAEQIEKEKQQVKNLGMFFPFRRQYIYQFEQIIPVGDLFYVQADGRETYL